MKTKFKINPDKIYKIIGQAVVYVTGYIAGGVFLYCMFLSGTTY